MGAFMTGLAPGLAGLLVVVNAVVSFALITLLFAMIFKFIPDASSRLNALLTGYADRHETKEGTRKN